MRLFLNPQAFIINIDAGHVYTHKRALDGTVLRNALEQGTGSAIVGAGIGLIMNGPQGALDGLWQGAAIGLMSGGIYGYNGALLYERNPWTGKLLDPMEQPQTLPSIQLEALEIKSMNENKSSITLNTKFGEIQYDMDGHHYPQNGAHKHVETYHNTPIGRRLNKNSKFAYPIRQRDMSRIKKAYNANWKADGWISPWIKG